MLQTVFVIIFVQQELYQPPEVILKKEDIDRMEKDFEVRVLTIKP